MGARSSGPRSKAESTFPTWLASRLANQGFGTDSWFGDGLSWQWSYYAALMSSATRLAAPLGGTRDFGGYVVPRSSGGTVEGALLRRVISLIGGGAKALTYFTFGPECERSNAS